MFVHECRSVYGFLHFTCDFSVLFGGRWGLLPMLTTNKPTPLVRWTKAVKESVRSYQSDHTVDLGLLPPPCALPTPLQRTPPAPPHRSTSAQCNSNSSSGSGGMSPRLACRNQQHQHAPSAVSITCGKPEHGRTPASAGLRRRLGIQLFVDIFIFRELLCCQAKSEQVSSQSG